MTTKITCKTGPVDIRIYFDEILHLHIDKTDLICIQSWYMTKTDYRIELYFKEGNPVILEYDSMEKWKSVLKLFDEHI